MGTEGIYIPLILAAAGAGAQYYNTRQTQKKQDNQLAKSIEARGKERQEQIGTVNELVQQIGDSSAAQPTDTLLQQYQGRVREAQQTANAGLSSSGAVSDRFTADAARAALGVADRAKAGATTAARIDAVGAQRQGEANLSRKANSRLNAQARETQANSLNDRMRLDAIRRDPLLDAFSQALNAAAASSATYGGGGWGAQTGFDSAAEISPNIYGRSGVYAGGVLA